LRACAFSLSDLDNDGILAQAAEDKDSKDTNDTKDVLEVPGVLEVLYFESRRRRTTV
jgi:hypothetical protein